jgi:ParB-like chromosome segregation protein Spo0J
MQVEFWDISDVLPYANNPRRNDQAVDAVARSIAEFGFRQPIVVDENAVIIVGNTRYKAALQLGLKQVPVHVAAGLTPAQVKAYRLADNKTAELAEWDTDRLVQELTDLQQLDFAIDVVGFSADELRALLDSEVASGLTDPDAVPEPPDEAVTRPGDLWVLGRHRLLCGDSAASADVDRLLAGSDIHLVNTDPPLFGGSGSTLIAAERTGRRAYLMEIDPLYCDVMVRRWEQHTGKQAECQPRTAN